MSGLIGKKIGMTSIFDENGKNIPCTIIEAGPCVVTQVRTKEVDGYDALQLGFDDKAEKRATKAELGHFKKAGSSRRRSLNSKDLKTITNWVIQSPLISLPKESLLTSLVFQKVKGFKG